MAQRDWVGLTAVRIAEAVRAKEVSPLDVVRQHLTRIGRVDPRINAFRLVRDTEVCAEAEQLARRPDIADLPLAGVPVAIKDQVDIAGCPTARGSAATSAEPAAADSELVARLRAAGALLIGKTNVPELCQWPFTETAAYGATRNPWHPEFTPGGSSGGSAAAVAAAMAPVALGSDGGGSIRIPASCCGLFGIKPGAGVVPAPGESWMGLSEFGPIATTVADATLLLDVLAGGEGYRRAEPEPGPRRGLRVGMTVSPPAFGVRVDPAAVAAVDAVAAALVSGGHTVGRVAPPWRRTDMVAFLSRVFAGVHADAVGLPAHGLEPRTREVVRVGRVRSHLRSAPTAMPTGLAGRFRAWFDEHDLLLTPTLATGPLPVGAFERHGMVRTMYGSAAFMPFTPLLNVVRYPAMSVPGGWSADGLPIGVQLAAAPGGEALLLAVAAQLEILHPWPRHAA
jgi:amidase